MTQNSGRAAESDALLNEGGPWGGQDGERPSPWSQPPKKRPTPAGMGPSALDALIRRGRARFGGNGPRWTVGHAWRWALPALVLAWIVLTGGHMIAQGQRGVVTRFGRYAGTLQPGLGFTLPAPFDRVTAVNVDGIHVSDIDGGDGRSGPGLLLTADQGLLDLRYAVRWNVRDPAPYLFQLQDPEGTIREVTQSAMRDAVAHVSLADAMGGQRGAIEARVAQRAQELLDGYHAGVAVEGVSIKQASPPAAVADAFKDVATAERAVASYQAQARTYAAQVANKAQTETSAFDRVYAQYALAPGVTRQRIYYETMEKVLAKTDKTIVDAPVVPSLPLTPAQRPQAAK